MAFEVSSALPKLVADFFPSPRRAALLWWVLPLLLALILSGCRSYNSPPELVGIWATDDHRYAGKFLQFDEKYVIISVGDDQVPRVQRIVRIKKSAMGIMRHYEFQLRDEDAHTERLALDYLPNDGGQIELSNPRRVIWKKTTPPPEE